MSGSSSVTPVATMTARVGLDAAVGKSHDNVAAALVDPVDGCRADLDAVGLDLAAAARQQIERGRPS